MAAKGVCKLLYVPGWAEKVKAHNLHENKPTKVVEAAVKGMLPKTKLGNAMIKNYSSMQMTTTNTLHRNLKHLISK